MKSFVAVLALVALAAADVSHLVRQQQSSGSDRDAQTLEQSADVFVDQFQYDFKTSNGIAAQASGTLKTVGKDEAAIVVQGSNQYTAPDGTPIQLSYVADENGYQPQGAHLPTPPPTQEIPEYILRSLEYIRTHPQPENQKY